METTQYKESGGIRSGNRACGCGNGDWNNMTSGAIDDNGGDGGLMALEATSPMANYGVSPFVIKLFNMVNDEATNLIISWGSSCKTFIIFDEHRFKSEILPCYFKSSRFDSFVYQLNHYGFKKNGWNRLEFEHEYFQEGKQDLLKNVKRRIKRSKIINNTTMLCVSTNEIKDMFVKVRQDQKQIKNRIQRFKDDVEKTVFGVQSISETLTHKLVSTFSDGAERKRKFVDIEMNTDFDDIEKDLESVYNQLEVSDSNDVDIFTTLDNLMEKTTTLHDGLGVSSGTKSLAPPFLHKLYKMVEEKEIDHLISWNLPSRDSFIIWDINKFATDVLPRYFCHTNFSSFNSQLNIYCFRKVSWERHEYANEWFRGGRTDLLANIKRRDKPVQVTGSTMTFSSKEVDMFKNRLKMMQQEQKNKITWLSNYEEQMKSSVHEFKEKVVNLASLVDKMILRKNEKHGHVKKAKLDIKENVKDIEKGQDSEVDEQRDNHIASSDSNKVEAQVDFQDLGIDLEAMEEIMESEHTWIIKREMDFYLSLGHENSNEINEKLGFDEASCS